MKTKILTIALCIVCLFAFFGCAEQVQLANLALADVPVTMAVGDTAAVTLAPGFSKDAPTEEEIAAALETVTLVWASSNEAVATVDGTGLVTAKAPGTAEITVSDSEGQYSAAVDVTVIVPVVSAVAPDEMILNLSVYLVTTPPKEGEPPSPGVSIMPPGGKIQVAIEPADATNVVIRYQSDNEAVATVNEFGVVEQLGEGEAIVTTTIESDGPQSRVTHILQTRVVVAYLPLLIELEQTEGFLYVGYSHQLKPYTLPEQAPESSYTYESSDPAVATVDESGTIKAVAVGTATITITSAEGHTASYAVTVTRAPASGGSGGGNGGSDGSGGSGGAGGSGDPGGAPGGDAPAGDDGGGSGGNPYPVGSPENPAGQDDFGPVNPNDLNGTNGWE